MDKTVLIIGAIILAIVIVVGLVFLFIVKNRNKPTHTCKNGPYIKQSLVSDTFSKRESGHFIDVNPSEYVRKCVFEKRGLSGTWYGEKDKSGRAKLRYFEGETIYKGKRCAYNEGDIPYLEKIVCNFFSVDCIEQNKTLIDEKITVLLNAIINSKDSSLHIDLRNFFEFNNCFAFVFNTDNDETITPYIYYLCSTRATSLRKLPVSTIKNQRNNYVAIFNKNTITDNDLRLLCYICLQKGSHSSFERINSIVSTNPISRNELSVLFTESREDFCTEYFYRILFDSSNILQSFTDRNILTEIMARVDGMYGWPHCYELSTQLEMMIVEMYNKGIIKVRYHSEIDLFNLVKEKYNDALFQYKDMWLENQSLDIYIPQWKIAIEYQGQQHYTSVKHFGGKNALAASRKRDKTKKELCTQNGVSLIEWKYDMAITKENVDKMLPYKSTL